MINIKKIAYLLFIAATAVDGTLGHIEEVARFYPEGPKSARDVEKRAQSGTCRIWDHSSVYHNGFIYVDFTLTTETAGPVGDISLLTPWSLNVGSDFTATGIDSSSLIINDLNLNSDLPYTMRGALWVSKNGTVYKYGGYYPQEGMWKLNNSISSIAPRNGEIWELNTKTRNWTKTVQPSGQQFFGARNGGVTSIPAEDIAFFLGGWSSNMTDGRFKDWTHGEILAHQSMLAWDIKGNEMLNVNTSFLAVTLSSLVHVPVGKYGILVSLGGNQFTGSRFNFTLDSAGLNSRSFDSIDIFDFEAGAWTVQATTGEIPPNRRDFCVAVATAADNSSFNIFMHGGANFDLTNGFSDTYVLSLPSFQWFRVDNTNKVKRYGVTCHLVKNKMIMIGGRDVDQPSPEVNITMPQGDCDPNGIVNIFDVNTLKWDPNFKVSKLENFKVNEKITGGAGIGGGPTGCATKIKPEGGWDSGELRERFANVVPKPQKSCTRTVSQPSCTSDTHPPRPSNASSGLAPGQGRLFSLGLLVIATIIAL